MLRFFRSFHFVAATHLGRWHGDKLLRQMVASARRFGYSTITSIVVIIPGIDYLWFPVCFGQGIVHSYLTELLFDKLLSQLKLKAV